MKQLLRIFGVFAVLTLCLCMGVFAEDSTAGIYNVEKASGASVTWEAYKLDESGGAEKISSKNAEINGERAANFYPDAEYLVLHFSGLNDGDSYVVFAMKEQADDGSMKAPTADNLVYIYQKDDVTNGNADFTVFPSELNDGETYYVFLSGTNESTAKKLEYSFTNISELLAYIRGDANGIDGVTIDDVIAILSYLAHQQGAEIDTAAADVFQANGEVGVDIQDVIQILKYLAHAITEL